MPRADALGGSPTRHPDGRPTVVTGTSGGPGPSTNPYVPTPRGPTSRVELQIAWDFPAQIEGKASGSRTGALPARKALPLAEAYAAIAGEDRRPLLVLRECLRCNGTDDALMTRMEDNERTFVMSRWFHCVKLPPDVLEEDHPFHALFAGEKPGHLFFARRDGTQRKDLNGQQSRTELWSLMEAYLAAEYQPGATASLKALIGLLGRFDRIDAELAAMKGRIDDLVEDGQTGSRKLERARARVAELEADKVRARAEAVELSALKLREPVPEVVVDPPAAPGQG